MVQTEASLEVDLNDDEHDVLSVDGNVSLDGTLSADLLGDFEPEIGDMFETITATVNVTGTFEQEQLPAVGDGAVLRTLYGPTSVSLLATFVTDFDLDGDVDGDDLAQWEADFAANANSDADGDGDGDSDGADFLAWQRQFGSGVNPLAAAEAVPEPSGLVITLLGMLTLSARRPLRLRAGVADARNGPLVMVRR